MEIKIVDEVVQPLLNGQEGRLLFRGIAVFTGYLNNDAATVKPLMTTAGLKVAIRR
jgi:long-subunit acyl-CoA synthetase (AMP-forming)